MSIRDRALEYVSQIRFHQSFVLSANPDAGRPLPIRVTYADLDYRPDERKEDGPAVVVIGGMFGGRYMGMGSVDALAKKYKIRCIMPDKFGLGGTGNVPLQYCIPAWLDMLPALLAHLSIKHVALLTHSNGTIYTFNTLLHLRRILHPTRPFVAFLAPWVHTSHSGSSAALSLVPETLITKWPSIARFMSTKVAPVFTFSGGIINNISGTTLPDSQLDMPEHMNYDPDIRDLASELGGLIVKLFMAENIQGGSDEAFLTLKRGTEWSWGLFEDIDEAISKVVEQERELAAAAEHDGSGPEKLRVQVFFAESDMMIGKQGQEWFNECWRKEACSDVVEYCNQTVPASNHENIASAEKGIVDRLFREVASSFSHD
ncbi:hypothetical protein MMC13_002868 [Lambiella insularis]|nr:hypothetical protein [Lambiella insularis]